MSDVAKKMARETHRGLVKLGLSEVECSNLDTGERVLSTTQVQGLIGASKNRHLTRFSMRIGKDSEDLSLRPITFIRLDGGVTYGYLAEDVVNILRALQRAFIRDELHYKQIPMARAAMACVESLISVGIIALIDEATGYQQVRPATELRDEHGRIFAERMRDWKCMFDAEWDKEICRVYGHIYSGRPPFFAQKWNDIVYAYALGRAAKDELKRMNPNPKFGRNHSQFLTDEAQIVLSQTIYAVKLILKVSRNPSDFRAKINSAFRDMPLQLSWE